MPSPRPGQPPSVEQFATVSIASDVGISQEIQAEKAGRAMMLGLALGDALGWPTEFKNIKDIQSQYGPQGIKELPHPAIFTDDTQMTIAVARAVIDNPWTALPPLMERMAKEFLDWGLSEDNNRAPGLSCMGGVRQLAEGIPWERSGGLASEGCGSAMRVAPIGFVYQDDPQRLKMVATASSLPTHRHPSAIASAVGAAYLVKLALDGVTPSEMPARVAAFVDGMSTELDGALARMNSVLDWEDEVKAMDRIGAGWLGYEAVPLALYCVMKYPDSWIETVRRGANFSGDSDSIASIAGGIQALRLGLDAIPPSWIERVERREELEDLGVRLAKAKVQRNETLKS